MMKDKLCGKIMTEIVAMRAKMYACIKIDKDLEDKPYNNTNKCEVAKILTFDDCFFGNKTIHREPMLSKNKKHKVYAVNKHKVSLNRVNEKRYILANGVTTLARADSEIWKQ